MSKVVAIHQPNFLPWLGYFDKIAQADVFVFLDNVPLQRTGGSYVNRVEMIVSGRRNWATVPVARDAVLRDRIADARIGGDRRWRRKLGKSIEQSYAAAPFFAETMPLVAEILANEDERLASFNIKAITRLCRALGLRTPCVTASGLDAPGTATDLLISIVRAVGGTCYLAGGGAAGYQQDEKFAEAGLMLRYQRFRHPLYPQASSPEFTAGLSIVDALMNCGIAGVARLLADARQPLQSERQNA